MQNFSVIKNYMTHKTCNELTQFILLASTTFGLLAELDFEVNY